METAVYDNITTLVLRGGGNVTVREDGTIEGARKVVRSGEQLVVEGGRGGGGSFISTNGSSFVFQGGDVSFSNFSGSTLNTMSNITINGRRVDLNRLDEIASTEEPPEPSISHRLGTGCLIKSINIKGSTSVSVSAAMMDDAINVHICGSGDVELPAKHFESININLTGSGSIRGAGDPATTTNTINVNLAGSGSVSDIHTTSGAVNMAGSGDVYLSADDPTRVTTHSMGSGRVRIR